MDKKIILFDVLNDTMSIVMEEEPGRLIPFKGDFPLVEPWQEELFRKGTDGKMYLEECEPWIQDILIKAQRIHDIEDGFCEYLKSNNIFQIYNKMDAKRKVFEISRFLKASSLDVTSLTIKKNGGLYSGI